MVGLYVEVFRPARLLTEGTWTGVLWSGDHLFDGIAETIELLRSKGLSALDHDTQPLSPRPGPSQD